VAKLHTDPQSLALPTSVLGLERGKQVTHGLHGHIVAWAVSPHGCIASWLHRRMAVSPHGCIAAWHGMT